MFQVRVKQFSSSGVCEICAICSFLSTLHYYIMCYRFSVIHCYLRHWWQRRYCFDRRLSVCLCVCLSEKNRITQSYGWIFLKFGKTVDFLIRVLRYVSGQTDGQTHGHAGCNTFHTYRGDVITSRCAMRSCVRGVAPAQCRPETSVASSE